MSPFRALGIPARECGECDSNLIQRRPTPACLLLRPAASRHGPRPTWRSVGRASRTAGGYRTNHEVSYVGWSKEVDVGRLHMGMLALRTTHRWVLALLGIISIIFGLVVLSWPGATLFVLIVAFGIFALVAGVVGIVGSIVAAIRHEHRWWILPGPRDCEPCHRHSALHLSRHHLAISNFYFIGACGPHNRCPAAGRRHSSWLRASGCLRSDLDHLRVHIPRSTLCRVGSSRAGSRVLGTDLRGNTDRRSDHRTAAPAGFTRLGKAGHAPWLPKNPMRNSAICWPRTRLS